MTRVQAALNGSRRTEEHPGVAVSAGDLAGEARGAAGAGAFCFHVHPRDRAGSESLDGDDVARAVAAIREACPSVPVGVTTGAWIVRDPGQRFAQVRRWTTLPDFASVNFHEDGAADLAEHLLGKGVEVEAGVSSVEGARALVWCGLAPRCLRILLEPCEARPKEALANLATIEAVLDDGGVTAPRLLHGMEAPVWELVRLAAERGYDTRAGLEDTLTLPDGRTAPGNAALVAAALSIIAEIGDRPRFRR